MSPNCKAEFEKTMFPAYPTNVGILILTAAPDRSGGLISTQFRSEFRRQIARGKFTPESRD